MEFIKGIDVSYHQDKSETPSIHIDFEKAKETGCEFTFIRSSIGLSTDRDFQINRKNSKGLLLRGYYHFLTWPVSGKQQAEYFYDLVKDDLPEIGLVVDFEANYKVSTPKTAIILLKDFLTELKKLYSGKIIIYTGAYFWKDYGSKDEFFIQFPLWLASYTTQDYMEEKLAEFTPWKTWSFWQFTDRLDGLAFGAESKQIDGNYFNGSLEELKNFRNRNQFTDKEKINILWDWYTQFTRNGQLN